MATLKYANLAAEMRRRGITQEQIGEAIGKTQVCVSRNMCGLADFRTQEMLTICDVFFPDLDMKYLSRKG